MMSNEVRPEQVYLFWEMMQQHYDSDVLDKPTAMEMRVLGWLLDLFFVAGQQRCFAPRTASHLRN